MKKTKLLLFSLGLVSIPLSVVAQDRYQGFTFQSQTLSNPDNEPAPVFPVPSDRQLKWNETEFYAFYHYGMNTYTNAEWGNGTEDESKFAPTAAPNPKQWLTAAK